MYDTWSGNVLGQPNPTYPAMSGALHPKYVNTPMNPGLLVRAFEQDPFSGSQNVEQPMGQNYVLTSGDNLSAMSPGQFFAKASQRDFTYPRVVPEFAIAGSGLPGSLGDAYPALTHDIGVNPNGSASSNFPLPGGF
jgi:hypothetical protein